MMSMYEHFLCLRKALVYPHGQYFDLKFSAKGIHYRILKSSPTLGYYSPLLLDPWLKPVSCSISNSCV